MPSAAGPPITVATISWRSGPLIERLFRELRERARFPESLCFCIGDNTGGADRELLKLDIPGLQIRPIDIGVARMSMGHALGLNALLREVATPYLLVADPDVALLARDWDIRLLDAIETGESVCIGAPYPPWKLGKYHAFPSPVFAFWRVAALRKLDVDWRPYAKIASRRFADFLLRQAFWLPRWLDRQVLRAPPRHYPLGERLESMLGIVSRDTGWRLAVQAEGEGMRSQTFDALVDPEDLVLSNQVQAECLRSIAREFELFLWKDEPFLTHRNPTWHQLDTSLWGQGNWLLLANTQNKDEMTRRWLNLVRQAHALGW